MKFWGGREEGRICISFKEVIQQINSGVAKGKFRPDHQNDRWDRWYFLFIIGLEEKICNFEDGKEKEEDPERECHSGPLPQFITQH